MGSLNMTEHTVHFKRVCLIQMDVVLLVLSFVKKNKMLRENLDWFPVILVLILNYTCHHANIFLFTCSKNSLLKYIIFKGSFLSFLQRKLRSMAVFHHVYVIDCYL